MTHRVVGRGGGTLLTVISLGYRLSMQTLEIDTCITISEGLKSGNASCKVGKHLGSQRDPLPTVW